MNTTIFIDIFISDYDISVKFDEIKCTKCDDTLQTVNTEFETTTSRLSKIVTDTYFCHVYNVNTSRTTWRHYHVYRVNRGCRRGHMLVTHWSKKALSFNLCDEPKRAFRLAVKPGVVSGYVFDNKYFTHNICVLTIKMLTNIPRWLMYVIFK